MINENKFDLDPSRFMIITYDVLFDPRLNEFQKLLFAAITGLEKGKYGYCSAGNEYFCKMFNKSQPQVSAALTKLEELGFIKREMVYKSGSKEIAFRKLTTVMDRKIYDGIKENLSTGIKENLSTGIKENFSVIDNNIINNITISKDIDEQANCSSNETKSIPKNNELLVKLYKQNETKNSDDTKVDSSSNNSSKGKGGLKPLIDLANDKFPKERYPDVNSKLITYLKCYLGCRRLPTLEKWEDMLFKLEVYSSVQIPGTSGSKFLTSRAIEIIEKAINGKNGAPYLDFDNLYGVKEPHLNSNQNFITGF